MKRILLLLTIICSLKANAQTYSISFSGTGLSSVKVQNQTTGVIVDVPAGDVLLLSTTTGITEVNNMKSSGLKVYPNPMTDKSTLEILSPLAGDAIISVCDMTGKVLTQYKGYLENYTQEFSLSGIMKGLHIITVQGKGYQFSEKLLSNGKSTETPNIVKISTNIQEVAEKESIVNSKGLQGYVNMYYTSGERLKYTAVSGNNKTVMTDIPNANKTVNFAFIECKDGDNNYYPVVQIGTQVWMAENLKTTKYNDGTAIPNITGNTAWAALTTGAYCDNDNSPANSIIYGRLYNWYTVDNNATTKGASNGGKNVCPTGWHISTVTEWTTLTNYLTNNGYGYGGSGDDIGKSMASMSGWSTSWTPGTIGNDQVSNNSSGFTALPSGGREGGGTYGGMFNSGTTRCSWWTSYDCSATDASDRMLYSDYGLVYSVWTSLKQNGNPVRCLQGDFAPILVSSGISTSETTQNTAISVGNIISDGGAEVIARGICWSTTSNPTIALSTKTSDGTGAGSFLSSLTGLSAGTLYYVRAYGTTSDGTTYGTQISFTTNSATLPVITTTAASEITQTTASSGGDITSHGGATVTARGVCWSTSANPTTALSTKTSDGTGTGSFSSSLTGLTVGTSYYLRAYATNSVGTAYGSQISFTTNSATLPVITTTEASAITQTTASSGGNITSDGGATVTARGVCWNTTINPTIALSTKTTDGEGTGNFVSLLTGLTPGNGYYVRAYATNSVGTSYGPHISFIATSSTVPVITTTLVSAITYTTASSGGNITSDGGATVTARGVCWSTTTGPTTALSTKTTDGTGTGTFTSSITALSAGTVYYIRAYATNGSGTAYGNEISFTTTASTVPILTTTAASAITYTTASSGGNITSDGGATVTARGVCWSTTTGPTTALSTKTTNNTGTGIFASSLTGLTAGTVYYVRAYATNNSGTAYGNEISFTTTATTVPILSTTIATSITSTKATSGGNVTADGGAAVTTRGVCWSTSANPTASLSTKTNDGAGIGAFISSITGLTPGTKYYVRAYATNSTGTGYGNEINFTTTVTTGVVIGQSFEGGVVAYVLQSGDPGYVAGQTHGIIASATDVGNREWGCTGTLIAGSNGTSFGTGNQNTIDIMAGCSTTMIAARLCGDAIINGYSDWYLPSKTELNKLYLNRTAIGGFVNGGYWSSSQDGPDNAWWLNFNSGGFYNYMYTKTNALRVRAVRAF